MAPAVAGAVLEVGELAPQHLDFMPDCAGALLQRPAASCGAATLSHASVSPAPWRTALVLLQPALHRGDISEFRDAK